MSEQVSTSTDTTSCKSVTCETASFVSSACAALLRTQADCMSSASLTIMQHDTATNGRASVAYEVSHDLYEGLLAAADCLSASLKQGVRASDADTQQLLTKSADDHEAMALLMDAGAAMSESLHINMHLVLTSLAALDKLVQSMDGICARLCVLVSALGSAALGGMSTVWRELPDGVVSTVSGRGMKSFVKGAAGATRNVVLVHPRVSNGALAEYVKPEDVRAIFMDDAGSMIDAHVTVCAVVDSGLKLTYEIATECASKLSVNIAVCGVFIGTAVTIPSGFNAINGANHVATYDVGDDYKTGMAVNADGSVMVVSFFYLNEVHVFRLTPSFEHVCVLGQEGTDPGEFKKPYQLCFTDDDTVLVCDCYNNRVQQLTVEGGYLSSFTVRQPMSIAFHDDMVAVCSINGPIEIHSLATGERLRMFGSPGDGPGFIGGFSTGIRFISQCSSLQVLIAEHDNHSLSLFSVDGVFMKHIGTGVLGNGFKDVSFCAGDEIIVADNRNQRICVFSSDGDTLIETWSSFGTMGGLFENPSALAVSGPRLFVLDRFRVHVFE